MEIELLSLKNSSGYTNYYYARRAIRGPEISGKGIRDPVSGPWG